MDWKLEQKRREKLKSSRRVESDNKVNIVGEMERDFAQIFGADAHAVFSGRKGQAGDHVRRSEILADGRHSRTKR